MGTPQPIDLQIALPTKNFRRRREDFTCDHCGFHIRGNGFTDHCPNCLWSKHVDIKPGDRNALCKGMMEPIGIKIESGKRRIAYRCKKCGYTFIVKSAPEDNPDMIQELSEKPWSFK